MDDSDDERDELFEEYMELKGLRYTESNKRGFNVLDGYFYTGVTVDGLEQVIYRDESNCLEVYHLNDKQKADAKVYWETHGLALDPNPEEEGD